MKRQTSSVGRLSCRSLRDDATTVHVGLVTKTHRDAFFTCLDRPVQRLLLVKGKYLFRYKVDKNGETKGAPTGLPVEICSGAFNPCPTDSTAFEITSLYQTYTYKCETEEEAKEWIQKLQFVKERVIKERMGHSSVASSDKLTNSVAAKQVQEAVLQKEIESHTQNMGALYAGVLA
jgi:hypothetical protein